MISIVLPIFNERTAYLRACLDSIQKQSFTEWECICVVESTNIKNIELISCYSRNDRRFKIIQPPKRIGLPASLNLAVNASSFELVARMDSDDIMILNRLELQYHYMSEYPSVSVVGAGYNQINKEGFIVGRRRYPRQGFALSLYFLFRCGLAHSTVMFRKSSFMKLGGYNEKLRYCEDLDLWLRFKRMGAELRNINASLINYRISVRKPAHWKTMIRVRTYNLFRITL